MNLNFIKSCCLASCVTQKPSVEINAPRTVKKNASGPTTTKPPTANPPVVKNNTKNPKNATNNAITPYTPIHANESTPKLEENIIASTKAANANEIKMNAIRTAKVVFHAMTISWNGNQMHQQQIALKKSTGTVHHKVIGL